MNGKRLIVSLGGSSGGGSAGGLPPITPALMQTTRLITQAGTAFQQTVQRMRSALPTGSGSGSFGGMKNDLRVVNAGFHLLSQGVKNISALFGPEGAAIGQIIQQGISAAQALYELTDKAASLGMEFAKIHYQAGGNDKETAQLHGISNLLGTDAGSLARIFADQIAHNGLAANFGARANLHDYGPLDSTDKAGKLLEFINYIRRVPEQEAIRAARVTKTEDLLPLRMLSENSFKRMQDTATFGKSVMDPEFLRQSAEFKAAISDLTTNFEYAFVETVKLSGIMGTLTTVTNALASGLKNYAIGLAVVHDAMHWGPPELPGLLKSLMQEREIMDRHTDAMENHTRVLREGVYGGGERARGAMPEAWKGMNAEVWGKRAAVLGAFAMLRQEIVPAGKWRRPITALSLAM